MTTALSTPGLLRRASAQRPATMLILLLVAAALLLRSATFGAPLAGYDEQLYLLIGARMWDGAVPYVDLWDRKPVGLFLVYAAIARAGGDGILAYQLAAALAAAATAFVIARIARRDHGWIASTLAALFYLLWLPMMGGEAGQSPIFYNLPMAGAALLVLLATDRAGTPGARRRGAAAMLLAGLAIQIKTTAVFEGCFFGLVLLHAGWRARLPLGRQIRDALLYMALGLAPTLAALGFYAWNGWFEEFWFANARSAMLRDDGWSRESLVQLLVTVVALLPVAALALLGRVRAVVGEAPPEWDGRFLAGWLLVATIGFVSVGYFYHHYALPLLVPLTLATARFFGHARLGTVAFCLLAAYPLAEAIAIDRIRLDGNRRQVDAIVAAIPADVRTGCMLVYQGPLILYHLTHACTVTRFAFPDHLHARREAPALGVDAGAALADALAKSPGVILTTEGNPSWHPRNRANDRLIAAELERAYRLRARLPYRYYDDEPRYLLIWERRPEATRTAAGLGNCQSFPLIHQSTRDRTGSDEVRTI